MFTKSLVLPLLAQVFLTFLVWFWMYITRFREMARKGIDPQQLHSRQAKAELLTDSAAPAANLQNLLEMPVLFYAAILLTLLLLIQDQALLVLAWTYVALRAIHSLVHCTYNRVMHRFMAYAASSLVLLLMWLRLAAHVSLR